MGESAKPECFPADYPQAYKPDAKSYLRTALHIQDVGGTELMTIPITQFGRSIYDEFPIDLHGTTVRESIARLKEHELIYYFAAPQSGYVENIPPGTFRLNGK